MGLFTRLEQFDVKLTRWYACWGRWAWGGIFALPILWILWSVGMVLWGPPVFGGVTLVIHNELDRPIRGFNINGVNGPNAFAHGGGKVTCCGQINGKEASVTWIVDYTRIQYETGVRTEVHHKTMPLPARVYGQDWLHVYFLRDNKILLFWSDGVRSPYKGHDSK